MHSLFNHLRLLTISLVAFCSLLSTSLKAQIELNGLTGSNGFSLNGITDSDQSGTDVSYAGDINNDGIDDILISAHFGDPNGSASGEAYVVFGAAGIGSGGTIDLTSLNGTNGFIINGIDADDQMSKALSYAGDVNDDGIDDIILGAAMADPSGNSKAGEAYVIFGATGIGSSGTLELSSLNGTNGFVINGIDVDDEAGVSVSAAGDVNNDGIADLILGAHLADPGARDRAGEAYVIFGDTALGGSGSLNLSSLSGSDGFVINGIDPNDRTGITVGESGDVNNDGIDDIFVGAYLSDPNTNNNSGECYIVFGDSTIGSSGSFELSALDGSNGFIMEGVAANDQSGFNISKAGDLNADGINDIIIGAHLADPNTNNNSGQSYVILGNDTIGASGVISLGSLNGTDGFQINGVDAEDRAGVSVSYAGDFNNDNIDDIIIGARFADPGGKSQAGEAYIVYGASGIGGSGVLELSSINSENGMLVNGANVSDEAGISVSFCGDINDDGFADVVIGANKADPNAINLSGASYVLFGPEPEIEVQGNFVSIADGDVTPSLSDDTDFGDSPLGDSVTTSFLIINQSDATLNLSGLISISGTHAGDFSISSNADLQVGTMDSTWFTVHFIPTATGARNATINIMSDDTDESLYDFSITGNGTAEEITIKGSGVEINDGDTSPSVADDTDFGNVDVGDSTDITYTIVNDGDATLDITLPVTVSGTHAADFTVVSSPNTSVASGDSTTFTVRFKPAATGSRDAELSIMNSDSDENPYNFNITGNGTTITSTEPQAIATIVSPNPFSESTKIIFGTIGARHIEVYNICGNQILAQDSDDKSVTLNIDAPAGVYIVNVTSDDGTKTYRVTKR